MAPGAVPPLPALDDARPDLAALPCPRCEQPLEPRSARCGACDLPLTGSIAASLWSVDQRIAALQRERAAVLARLVASDGARGGASTTPDRSGSPPVPADGAGAGASDGSQGAQRVLLVAGVVLVTASALGLGALAVTRLGALGQLAVLALLVAGALAASRWSLARRLTASGESFAVLAVALATTGAGAVRSRGVVGPQTVPDRAWPLVVVVALCLLSAAAASLLRRGGRPMAFGWAALATGALVPSMLAVLLDVGGAGLAAVLLSAAALLPLVAPALRSHGPVARGAVLVVAALHLVVGALVTAGLLVDDPTPAETLVLSGTLAALAAVAVVWVRAARRVGVPSALAGVARSLSPAASVVAWVAGGAAVLAAASAGGGGVLVVVAAVVAAAACAAVLTRAPGVPWASVVTAQALAAACLLLGAAQSAWDLSATVPPSAPTGTWAAWVVVAAAAATTAALRPVPPARAGGRAGAEAALVWVAAAAAAAVAAALSVPSTWPATVVGGQDPSVPALAVVATLALALATHLSQTRARPGAAVVLVTAWAVALLLALAPAAGFVAGGTGTGAASEGLPVPARAVLALAGAQALVLGILPRWAPARAAGVALLALAWWATAGDLAAPDAAVEVWSLPPALLALVVGALTWRSHPSLSSWATLGPALLLGLAPSTVVALTLDAPDGTDVLGSGARPAVVVVVALALVLAGVRRSWQAPLLLGAAAAVLVGLAQLGPYLAAVPLWVTTGAAGVVVLALAVRLEVARRSSARALSWLAALR